MRRTLLLPLLLSAGAPGALRGQRLPTPVAGDFTVLPARRDQCCPVERVIGSAVVAAAGGLAGTHLLRHVGAGLGGAVCPEEECGALGWVVGAVVGEVVGIGIGAHVGDGGRGKLLNPIGASLGVLILSGVVHQYADLGEAWLVVLPVTQIAAAVWAELR
jgi:hypothetical protein